MHTPSPHIALAAALTLAVSLAAATRSLRAESVAAPTPSIEMAILLDNSGSMEGLINQARSELWRVVNEFVNARQNGVQPELRVALYEYGSEVRLVAPLTTDLDLISEKLFALSISGGTEKCGEVIQAATDALDWSDSKDDLKVVFIAGNEPFTQGAIDFRQACSSAIARGITVNTIHCGNEAEGLDGQWKEGAMLADGNFLNIDADQVAKHIEAPQDVKIAELGVKLNATYIPFGDAGHAGQERQSVQDANAADMSLASAQQRALTKSSAYYRNSWCLADQWKSGDAKIEDIAEKDLPENMRTMSVEERTAYVEAKLKERDAIQKEIQTLNTERNAYVVAKRAESAAEGGDTLDQAMIQTVRTQAMKKHFSFE